MPAAVVVEPAIMEAPIQPAEILESPEEPTSSSRPRNSRTGLMKPLIVLALPGMYLFYKYNQYRREHRETTRKKSTEKELQHLHHKIVSKFFFFSRVSRTEITLYTLII